MARGEKEVSIIVNAKNKARGPILSAVKDLRSLGAAGDKELGRFGNSIKTADKVVMGLGGRMKWMDKIAKRTLQGTAAAAGIYATATVRQFSQLEDGISKVNTLYDYTEQSRQKMMKGTIDTYRNVIDADFSEITQATLDTISSGADPSKAADMTKLFGYAGVAGDANLSAVVEASMNTLNAFEMEEEQLRRILDMQFGTIKEGIISYEELSASFGTGVLRSAKDAGFSVEELYAGIAHLTKVGNPGSVASTALNQLYGKFTDPEVIKNFKGMNVEIQDANRHTRPFLDILKDINKEFDRRNYTSEQRKGFLKGLVGDERTGRALAPLLGDLEEYERILNEIENPEGNLKHGYFARLESMQTQFKMFWDGLKADGVEQIMTLEPFIQKFLDPTIKRHKIKYEIEELEEKIEHGDTPANIELYQEAIFDLQTQLDSVELAPLKELQDSLKESVNNLEELNPPLAKFVDTIGNLVLAFTGDEGQENRDRVKKGAKGVAGMYAGKKTIDALAWISKNVKLFTGDKEGKGIGDLLSDTMNVNAAVVNVYGGKNIPNPFGGGNGTPKTGTPPVIPNTPRLPGSTPPIPLPGEVVSGGAAFGSAATEALVAGAPALAATFIALYKEKQYNDKRDTILKDPSNYVYDTTQNKYVTKQDWEKTLKNQAEQAKGQELTIKGVNQNSKNISTLENRIEQMPAGGSGVLPDLVDMHLKQAQIDNHIDLQNEVRVDAPQVTTKVMIDGSNIPIQSVQNDYSNVEQNFRVQKRRRGNKGHHPDIY